MTLPHSKMRVWLACFIILSLTSPSTSLPLEPNTPLSEIAVCVFRVSGTYGTFSRFLYYSSLLFSTRFRQNEWLAAGILATAMLTSSVAIVHAWIILWSNGCNPKIIDLDIIPITTITVSTTFFFGAIRDYCKTLSTSSARDILYIWSIWLCTGCMVCCAATWNLKNGPRQGGSSQVVCYGNSTGGNATASMMLSARSQLESRNFTFNCTYDCLSTLTSMVRGEDEIRVIRHDDFYTTYLAILPFFALAAIIRDNIMLAVRWQLSRLLRTTNWRPYNMESAMFFVWIGKRAVQKALTYSISKRFSAYWAGVERRVTKNLKKHPLLIFSLQKCLHPTLAESPRNASSILEHGINALNLIVVVCPGLAVVILGEAVLLRRERLLKSEDFKAIGQWSVLVCTFLLASITVLDWKLLRQMRLQTQPDPDEHEALVPMPPQLPLLPFQPTRPEELVPLHHRTYTRDDIRFEVLG